MKSADTMEMATAAAPPANQVHLPLGLLGFEQIKNYVLLADPAEQPFAWLRVADNTALAFVVMDPFLAVPEYAPDIPPADADSLGLKTAADSLLLNIVTVHGAGRATVNLKGPIVINRHTRTGRQVIIANAADYSVQHPLPVA